MPKIHPKAKAGCGALLLFSAGMIMGVVALLAILIFLIPRSEGWKREESKEFLAQHFSRKLGLTEAQQTELRPGFDAYLDRRWELRRDYLKEDRRMLEEYFEEIKPSLNPDQIETGQTVIQRWWKSKQAMVMP